MFVEQRLQKVHSNEQIIASTESAGNGIAQCSQAFLISNILSSYSVMRFHHDRLEISLFDETFDIVDPRDCALVAASPSCRNLRFCWNRPQGYQRTSMINECDLAELPFARQIPPLSERCDENNQTQRWFFDSLSV
jgi:hypothetical protein